jgi:hypothetical protein
MGVFRVQKSRGVAALSNPVQKDGAHGRFDDYRHSTGLAVPVSGLVTSGLVAGWVPSRTSVWSLAAFGPHLAQKRRHRHAQPASNPVNGRKGCVNDTVYADPA